MIRGMVDGDLEAKIVEARRFDAGYEVIFFQNLPDSRERVEHHGTEVKIIADAPQLIIIQRMKGLPGFPLIIEIRIDQARLGRLSHPQDSLQAFWLHRNLPGPRKEKKVLRPDSPQNQAEGFVRRKGGGDQNAAPVHFKMNRLRTDDHDTLDQGRLRK